ncbi:MAG: DNA cytosine methyltransferase [Candidatus Woesearchaeota archaeon]
MKVISLFCGAGGMDLGFLKAGHEIVWSNDNDKDSIETYRRNICKMHKLPESHIVLKDIETVKANTIPDGDVVIGGFPCQGFSIANPYRHTTDERNKLYLELLKIIKSKNPKYFVGENVSGLCSIGGYETPQDKKKKEGCVLKMILNDLRKAGYHVEWKILNAADFGVPQTRRRVIMLGTRKDVKMRLRHPEPTHTKYPEKFPELKEWETLGNALSGLPENPTASIPNHLGTGHQVKINGFIGNRRTDPSKPSPTIVGRGGGTGGPVIIPHPNLKRRMTVRETARLQCFPDDFIFEGSISSQYRQIGNAVPWPLAYHIAINFPKE